MSSVNSNLAHRGEHWARATRALLGCAFVALLCLGCQANFEARLAEANALQEGGEFSESIGILREVLAVEPSNPEANHLLGVALLQTGQHTRAIWPLQKAAETDEYAVRSGLLLTSTLFGTRQNEEAIRSATRVLEVSPEHTGVLHGRGQANMAAGHYEDALADADRLLQIAPDDTNGLVLRAGALLKLERVDEGEKVVLHLREVAAKGEPGLQLRACVALAGYYEESDNEDAAKKTYTECVEQFPGDVHTLRVASDFFRKIDATDEIIPSWRRAVEEVPESYELRALLADELTHAGEKDEARTILEETADTFDSGEAWLKLARFHQQQNDSAAAREAIERAIERATGDAGGLRFTQADLLIDMGELDRAEAIAAELSEPAYRELIRGRILLARGNPQAALSAFEAGINRWPNNAGARYLAGQAAQQLGNHRRALAEYREAVRADQGATDAELAMARIYFAMGNFDDALGFSRSYVRTRGFRGPDAYSIGARSATALGDYAQARRIVIALTKQNAPPSIALVELAAIERVENGPAAAIRLIEKSDLDLSAEENENALRFLVENEAATDRTAPALARVDAALAKRPEQASLYVLRGRLLIHRKDTAAAEKAFERAAELDPENAEALIGLGHVASAKGDVLKAVGLFDKSAELDPNSSDGAFFGAQILAAAGREDEAEKRLRTVLQANPGHSGAANNLAWILAERGKELPFALDLAKRAARVDPSPEVLDTLGWVELKSGDAKAAQKTFESALAAQPNSPSIQYRLGLAQLAAGDPKTALATLRKAVGAGDFPESEAAQAAIARLAVPSN